MPSHWGMVDRLCRELGSLRDDARGLEAARVEAAVIADVDAALARAAAALDATIERPQESHLFIGACDAVAVVRERIQSLRTTIERSRTLVDRSVALRARSVRLMFEAGLSGPDETGRRRA
jgi:DNA polymerase III delta prime subunit